MSVWCGGLITSAPRMRQPENDRLRPPRAGARGSPCAGAGWAPFSIAQVKGAARHEKTEMGG
jgi:hypothetical protein